MQLKKIFISLLVVVIALATFTTVVFAADEPSIDFAVSVSGTADADGNFVYCPGDTVDVVIDVHNNPGIALLEVYLKYDSAILAPVDKNNDGAFTKEDCVAGTFLDADTYVFDAEAGLVTFKSSVTSNPTPIVDAEGNVIKSGEIVKLSFKVLENAHDDEAAITISAAKAVAISGGKMASVVVNKSNAKYAVHTLETVTGTPATCFTPGSTDGVTCKLCDYGVASEVLPPLNHPATDRETIPAVPGSCTTPAVSEGVKCGLCQTVLVTPQVGDSVAHVPSGVWVIDTAATHTSTGKQHQNCANCDAVALVEIIPQLVKHTWVAGTTEVPTCLDAGYTNYSCECGETKIDNIVKALGHDWNNGVENKAPTCTTVGETTYTCNACKETKTVNVPAKSHDVSVVVVAPTCTEKGYNETTCKVCGDYKVDAYVPAKGHTYTSSVVVEATCTVSGETLYTCVCGDKYTENIAPKGHVYSSVATAPTCTAMGYTTYTCACGDKYVADYVDAKGHTATEIAAIEATYSAEGATKGEKCSVCDTVLDAPHTIAKKSATMIIIFIVVSVVFAGVFVAYVILDYKQVWIFKKK